MKRNQEKAVTEGIGKKELNPEALDKVTGGGENNWEIIGDTCFWTCEKCGQTITANRRDILELTKQHNSEKHSMA